MERRVSLARAVAWFGVLLFAAGCVSTALPPGYEGLRTEATMVEVANYIKTLRAGYVQARQRGQMTPAQFLIAVKADQSLTVAWEQLLAAQKVKADTAALWARVIQATTTLENLTYLWLPPEVRQAKPAILGAAPTTP